jgi:hypothetical protein
MGAPGLCGIDDDGNGITDITDVPGVPELDDDRDGTTDEVGEFQLDQGDLGMGLDSDDIAGDQGFLIAMRGDFGNTTLEGYVGLLVNPNEETVQFAISETSQFFSHHIIRETDELGIEFYQPNVHYNFTFCATGSIYAAQLWIKGDDANILATLDPKEDTNHLNKSIHTDVAIITFQDQHGLLTPVQNQEILPNTYFCNKFWVVEDPDLGDSGQTIYFPDREDPEPDGIPNFCDNCPDDANPDQADDDTDTVGNVCDNCVSIGPPDSANPTQQDADADGTGDPCDVCPANAPMQHPDFVHDAYADLDQDCDVDGTEYAVFASCFNGAGNPPRTLGCTTGQAETFDTDDDNDVDGVDFAKFASCFNGAGKPARVSGCLPRR